MNGKTLHRVDLLKYICVCVRACVSSGAPEGGRAWAPAGRPPEASLARGGAGTQAVERFGPPKREALRPWFAEVMMRRILW